MPNKKRRFAPLIVYVLLVVLLAACDSTGPGSNTSSPTSTAASASTVIAGNGTIKSITVATLAGEFRNPQDSTPDLTGTTIYFTATGPDNKKGVFQVPAAGGTATAVFLGDPFVAPRSLVLSLDGKQIYVTDPSALDGGAIFALPIDGGPPTPVRGSRQTVPQNLDAVNQNGQETIYFTGKDPSSGKPAVLKLLAEGADTATVVIKGSPLVAPDGIVVGHTGMLAVSDRSAAGGGFGQIFKVEGGTATAMVQKIHTGEPAGIAFSADESTLLASAHQLDNPADQVLQVNLSTLQAASATGEIGTVVGQNHSAGGLHESHNVKGVFSWDDSTAGPDGRGRVYTIR